MRTTLSLDDDVFQVVKTYAENRKRLEADEL